MSVSFLRSLLSSTAVAAILGLAMLMVLFIHHGSGHDVDAFPTVVAFASLLVGLAAGLVAARHAPGRGLALAAGLLAAVVGQLVLLALTFSGAAIITFDEAVPALDPLAWSEFGAALLTLLPAGVVGLVAAPLAVPRDDPNAPLNLGALDAAYANEPADLDAPDLEGSDAHDGYGGHDHADAHADAEAPADAPAADTRRLKCPECGTINEAVRGQRVRCYHCGLTGRTPA